MRLRFLTILALGTLLASSASLAQASNPRPSLAGHGTGAVKPAVPHSEALLYSQNDSDGFNGITSQNFETAFDAYDNQGADDFTVPAGVNWRVRQVVVTGTYAGFPGPAVSENVSFYRDAGGLPGALITTQTATGIDHRGSFAITLPAPLQLKQGTYWVSVQVNMDFGTGGQWYWEARTVQDGNPAAWQNPGDGFLSGCTTWGVMENCIFGGPTGIPDFMFALYGAAR